MTTATTRGVYDHAALYDAAFSYRDIGAEAAFLRAMFRRHAAAPAVGDGAPRSVLEIASGSGRHALALAPELSRVGSGSLGSARVGLVDLSAAMLARAEGAFAAAAGSKPAVALDLIHADMTRFRVDAPYDLALCMLDSLSHVNDEAALAAHFTAVAEALSPGGVYVAELSRPAPADPALADPALADAALADAAPSTAAVWTVETDAFHLDVAWGAPPVETLDAARRIQRLSVRLVARPKDGGEPVTVDDAYVAREWTFDAVAAALSRSGALRLAGAYSDFSGEASADPADPAASGWRMILVFTPAA